MEVLKYNDFINLKNEAFVCSIGDFDGIHIAHQALINKTIELAKKDGLKSVIMTFDPHPRSLIQNKDYQVLMSLDDKIKLFKKYSVDYVLVIDFDDELMNMDKLEFVEKYLINLGIKKVVVGFDFHFGANGSGTPIEIKKLSMQKIDVIIIDEISYENKKIGSSLIKDYLAEGNILLANSLLGHPYKITGRVVKGNQIGRTINLPTANILPNVNYAPVKAGVYAVIVLINKKEYIGLLNYGLNPSFNKLKKETYEVNIIDFNESLYEKEISVFFYAFIRDEMTFKSLDDFLNQIKKDKEKIINLLTPLVQ